MEEEFFDRSAFCDQVGIHRSTLAEWIRSGVIRPHRRGFTSADVRRGRGFKSLSARYRGQYRREDLVEFLDGDREIPEYNNSPHGAPRPHQEKYEAGRMRSTRKDSIKESRDAGTRRDAT